MEHNCEIECPECGTDVVVQIWTNNEDGCEVLAVPIRYDIARISLAWLNAQAQIFSAVVVDVLGLLRNHASRMYDDSQSPPTEEEALAASQRSRGLTIYDA